MNAEAHDPNNPGEGSPGARRMEIFEQLLKEDVDAGNIDWAEMEKSLLVRIQAAENQGPLIGLMAEKIPPGGFLDRLEADLFARIRNHREYQEPIDDVIAAPEGLSDPHWQRLESKLDERIRAAQQSAPWERALMAGEDPSPGRWEEIEGGLQGRLDAHKHREPWELALKAEETLTSGRWEAIEEKLEARMDRQRKLNALSTQPFWLGLGFYLSRTPAKAAAALLLGMGLILGSLRVYQERFRPIDTVIYQAQGTSAGELDRALAAGSMSVHPGMPALQAKKDGALVMVNKRGFVDMRNGSRLEIKEANQRKIHYQVAFAGRNRSSVGNITFFVNKARSREKFLVSTPDYRIEVLGTYFRVDPDMEGRFSTAVLEGKVRIRSKAFGDFTVEAGQSLAFDAVSGRYHVLEGGRSVPREEIETLPGVDELLGSGILSLTSDALRAEVRIDGRYRGLTPLVVLVPPGSHSLHLSKEGHAAYDTMVAVQEGMTSRMAAVLPVLEQPPAPIATRPAPKVHGSKSAASKPAPPAEASAAPPAPKDESVVQLFHRADEAQSKDWRLAIMLYTEVIDHPKATAMRKEAARFSIARLRADHESEKSRAKDDFLQYLALNPDGAFAGESWMRLAELEVGINPEKAIEYYLRCIGKLPRHHRLSELQHRVGLLYLQNKRYDEAIAMFRQSLGNVLYNSEPERRMIYSSLYRAYVAKGDLKSAEKINAMR